MNKPFKTTKAPFLGVVGVVGLLNPLFLVLSELSATTQKSGGVVSSRLIKRREDTDNTPGAINTDLKNIILVCRQSGSEAALTPSEGLSTDVSSCRGKPQRRQKMIRLLWRSVGGPPLYYCTGRQVGFFKK